MIRIVKPTEPPLRLTEKGLTAAEALQEAFDQASGDYQQGLRTFSFDREIYGHSSVKNALVAAQHGKCGFCEAKIRHVSYGDVEHFRPKGGFRQAPDGPLERPGYFWLAYRWENLYLSCQLCNQRHKKNHFPLQDPDTRCRDPRGDLASELPLFIDPGLEDPEQYIRFQKEQPAPVDGNERGAASIKALGLLREELREVRSDAYQKLAALRGIVDLEVLVGQELAEEARTILEESVLPQAEYSSMARSLLAERPLP